jgi:uncharacterized metal-binding protein
MHTTATLCLTAAVVPYYGLDRPDLAGASLLAGLWAVLVQPDLDQIDNGGYYGFYVLDKTGKYLKSIWAWYWKRYSKMRHRAFMSHAPVVGTVGRLVYGGWWFLPFILNPAGAVFVTIVLSADFLHWVMDWKLWTRLGVFAQ